MTETDMDTDTNIRTVDLEPGWLAALEAEFEAPYMAELRAFLQAEKRAGKRIFPPGNLIFNALNTTSLDKVRVVILGQDPYHGPNQAHGLCFSVQHGVRVPPSLKNIYKELQADVGCDIPNHGYLQFWAEQGVLLLNATLTVEANQAGSHQGKGWEQFTDRIVHVLNEQKENLVFLLWGSYAQRKGEFINRERHLVLQAAHPSPFAAHRGFFGCRHFSQTNAYLEANGLAPINWQVPLLLE